MTGNVSITPERMTFVVGEYLIPMIFLVCMTVLFVKKKIRKAYFLYWIGFGLGSIWEWAHYFIPNFINVSPDIEKYIPGPVYNTLHSFHDAVLFVIGYALCYWIFRGKPFETISKSIGSLVILFIFFIGVEITVEIFFNNSIWLYTTDERNPALFEFTTGSGSNEKKHIVNCWPVYEWVVATLIFWVFCFFIKQKSRNQDWYMLLESVKITF